MAIISYSYKNDREKFLSEHFQVKEFASFGNGKLYSDVVLIDDELISKLETLFSKLNASKCIISSGYRTKECDIAVGGSGVGQHVNGKAADCIYYDENGNIIPSKIVICVAFDLGIFNGIANIDGNYTHLDNRQGSTYRGDEPRGNSSYWTNPYDYFGVSKEEVRKYTKEEISNKEVNVYYQVKTQKHGWLPIVKNNEDYAGWEDSPITDVAIKVDKGSIKYRVHVKGGEWLPYVTGFDTNDITNGYGGNGKVIDAIEVYYYTPSDIRPYKKAKYKVNNYPYQYDNEKTNGQDGYGGEFGVSVTKFQIVIE